MHLRDYVYAEYDVAYLVGGLQDSVIQALPDALGTLVAEPGMARLRRAWRGAVPSRRRLSVPAAVRAARAAMQGFDGSLTDAAFIAAVERRGFGGLPIALGFSGDRVVVLLSHSIGDASASLVMLHYLFDVAAGDAPSLDRSRAVRAPLLRGLIRAGLPAVRAFRAHRGLVSTPPAMAPEPTPDQAALRTAGFAEFALNAETLAAVKRGRVRGAGHGRATLNSRLASVAIAALRDVYLGTTDLRVMIPVDLRHFAPSGRVDGNFVSIDPVGGLLDDSWSPQAISARLADARSASALVSLAYMLVRNSRELVHRGDVWREYTVSVSIVSSPQAFPSSIWIDPDRARLGCATIGPWPASVFVFVWTAGERVHLSVWDQGELFDLPRFESAFRAEVEARRPAPAVVSDAPRPTAAQADDPADVAGVAQRR